MCHQLLLNCGWDGNHYLSTGAPFPSPSEINSTGSFVRRLTGVLGGSRPREAMALDLQIHYVSFLLSHTHPCSGKEAKGRAPGHLQYKLRLKAKVCDPGRLQID